MRTTIVTLVLIVFVVTLQYGIIYNEYKDYERDTVIITECTKVGNTYNVKGLYKNEIYTLHNSTAQHNVGDICTVALVGDQLHLLDNTPVFRAVLLILGVAFVVEVIYFVCIKKYYFDKPEENGGTIV